MKRSEWFLCFLGLCLLVGTFSMDQYLKDKAMERSPYYVKTLAMGEVK